MAKEYKSTVLDRTLCTDPGDEIVITGISGRFPNSDNMFEFEHNLYNKIDMVDDDERRWRHEHGEIPKRSGKINNIEKFDATFFGVHFKQAHTMDPQGRILIETAYEAVLDAGINPKSIRNKKVGVFVGACFSESDKTWFYEKIPSAGFGITGCSRAMLANRVSYSLGVNGPSFLVDTACSSSMYALDMAFTAIRTGQCDAAIIGATNLLLHPYVTLQFAKLGVLAADGFCRPFDDNASGYTRAETISSIYIQKARDAKRIYCSVLHSKTNCDGYKEEGITFPSGAMQAKLLKEFYEEIKIKPETVNYVEAHSTGTVVGDPEECHSLDMTFCTNRKTPLPVGSVKSNVGHTEPSAGMCSIAKCILAFEKQLIAPNINISKLRTGIKSLEENRLQVVTDVQKLDGPLIAINSFGFGGANAHALIKAHPKEKINNGAPLDSLPRLVHWSGRTQEACNVLFDYIESNPLDAEYIGLLHNTQCESVPGLVHRSYGLFQKGEDNSTVCVQRDVQHYTGIKRPIVYVFSGMGSQWTGMGTALMEIPIIRNTIAKCHNALKPKGIDLINIITSQDPTTFDNILHSFVGIASIQVAICDLLQAVGLSPDIIIGHSVGELGCAYADGCLSAEEMVLCAYSRGLASLETKKIRGAMAAVGMGYRQIRNILPSTIDVACHNGQDSCTISGPEADVTEFVAKLVATDVFAREVPCSNIAYHSRYIQDMGPKLLGYLSKIITDPKKRSSKWLSTSVPKSRWDIPENQYCTSEYQTNNLLSSVLFEETSSLLPSNALAIEIAPHGLLQAILRKSLPNAVNIPLTQRGNKDNLSFFLNALGKIYMAGFDLQIQNIYPPIQFPVSRGTPMISPLTRWDHSEDWFVTKFEAQRKTSSERKFYVKISDNEFEYITGHLIDGRCLFPATGYLMLVWESLSKMHDYHFSSLDVEFTDVKYLRATTVTATDEIEFVVMIHTGTGRFEIVEGTSAVVTGCIRHMKDKIEPTEFPPLEPSDYPMLPAKDFYKELRLRGYHYNGQFRSVTEARSDGLYGRVKWDSNWVAFMDCLLQITILGKDSRALQLPTRIEKLTIDTHLHAEFLTKFLPDYPDTHVFECYANPYLNIAKAGGIEIKGLHASPVARRKPPGLPVLESYLFVPHFPTPKLTLPNAVRFIVQTAIENTPVLKVKTVEIIDDPASAPIIGVFKDSLEDLPLITAELIILSPHEEVKCDNILVEDSKLSLQSNCMFIIKSNAIADSQFIEKCGISFETNGYLISRESPTLTVDELVIPQGFQLVGLVQTEAENLVFLRKQIRAELNKVTAVKISAHDTEYKWLDVLRDTIKEGVIAYSENEPLSGIVGLINCVRREPSGHLVSCFFIDDPSAPPFDITNSFYGAQIALGLGVNVYRQGQWGTYRHLQLEKKLTAGSTDMHAFVNMMTRGDLSSLKWIRGMLNDQLITNANLVKVQYSSLNFRDVMVSTGKLAVELIGSSRLDLECVLGFEYSGINQYGERVMGMVISGALSTHIIADPALTWKCPDNWDLKDAATVPVVYGTVYAAMFLTAKVQRGKSILIHAGTGGVGLAAIRVSLAYGLIVYTTVSTNEKKQFLLATYPELKESHIGNSRDCSFETMVKLQTKGLGVDYVINSLADDKLHASIRCLGKGGQFLEIGKFDIANNTKIGLAEFMKELSFHAVLVDNLFTASLEEKMALRVLVEKDMQSGIIKPLPATIYQAHEVEQAYRFLASAKHIGKVLVQVREHEYDKCSFPISVISRLNCDPDLSYIIPGGLGGFGLELADWLIIRGARKLVLSSSRGLTKPYQSYRIKLWRSYGATVVVDTSDISTPVGCQQLIREAIKLGPVAGIFNLAVVLRDSILENQTPDKFIECLAPKADATKYLDEISRKLCPFLKHFIIFSSVSCGRGNAGQSNYGMANSIMERIIEQRHRDGLPAKAIQWGAVGEVGLVADMQEDKLDMEIGGTLQQRISSCLEELDSLLFGDEPVVSSMVVAEKRCGSVGRENIIETIMNIMSIRDIKSVSMDSTLSEMGMDSLMAVEIKQSLEREFELFLTPQDLRSLTFAKLQELSDNQHGDGREMKSKIATDENLNGMQMLIRSLGDEHNSAKTILRLKTMNNSDTFDEAMIIVPGVEGVAGMAWHNIAAEINMPVFCLQLTETVDITSGQEIVNAIMVELKAAVLSRVKKFHFVGYSFGSYITLLLAHELERQNMRGTIVLLDGSPDFLKKLAAGHINTRDLNENSLQILIATNIVRTLIPDTSFEELFEKFVHIPTWPERVNALIELTRGQNMYSLEYLRKMANGLLNRVSIVLKYAEADIQRISSEITLIRCSEVSVVDIDEDYELYKYTSGIVNLKFIDGNHITMLENPKLAAIINELIHDE